jgi:hypothetical protein
MVVWIIAGAASASHNPQCAHTAILGAKACQNATDAGTGIGVGLLIGLWGFGDVILGVLWMVTRGRACQACGRGVRRGVTACTHCGFDLRLGTAGATPQAG